MLGPSALGTCFSWYINRGASSDLWYSTQGKVQSCTQCAVSKWSVSESAAHWCVRWHFSTSQIRGAGCCRDGTQQDPTTRRRPRLRPIAGSAAAPPSSEQLCSPPAGSIAAGYPAGQRCPIYRSLRILAAHWTARCCSAGTPPGQPQLNRWGALSWIPQAVRAPNLAHKAMPSSIHLTPRSLTIMPYSSVLACTQSTTGIWDSGMLQETCVRAACLAW